MVGETWGWDSGPGDERTSSGVVGDLSWEDWDGLELDSFEKDVCDAFELDNAGEDPEPEYGDFWLETDEDEEGA